METTLAYLHKLNYSHENEHGPLTETERTKIDALRKLIENRSLAGIPAPGDIVILHGYSNADDKPVIHTGAHLEHAHIGDDAPQMSCCVHPYKPHVRDDGTMCASGGYWLAINPADLTHAGTREKEFWAWRSRPCANGGITFSAEVNVWEYTDIERIY